MSFEDEARRAGRHPVRIVELVLDACPLTFGTAPCTATGSGDRKCYNTIATCRATAVYSNSPRTYRFMDNGQDAPPELDGWPAIVDVTYTPARLTPGEGLGESAQLDVRLLDFPDSDAFTDQYRAERSYNPASNGTFFGKLQARNKYLQGRVLRYREGYLPQSGGTFTFSSFLDREFIIDSVTGPDANGAVRIRATDVLRLTNDDRALCPVPGVYALVAAVASSTANTDIYLPSSSAAALVASHDMHVRIDDEILALGTQVGCSFTGCVRGRGGTLATDHGSGSTVQPCATFSYTAVNTLLSLLLTRWGTVPSSYIPTSSWNAERTASLSDYNLYSIITEPTPVRQLVDEVIEECDLALWYDEVAKLVQLKNQLPWLDTAAELNDDDHFLRGSLKVKQRDDLRLTHVGVYYAPRNYVQVDNYADFTRYQEDVLNTREAASQFGARTSRIIKSRWLTASHANLVSTLVGRQLDRYGEDMPLEVSFELDAKDGATLYTGHIVNATTRIIQDIDGTLLSKRFQIIEHAPEEFGSVYGYAGIAYVGIPSVAGSGGLVINANTYNYNVASAIGSHSGPVVVNVTINNGVIVYGNSYTTFGFDTGPLAPGSVVNLTVNGSIYGAGGVGNAGGDPESEYDAEPPGYYLFGAGAGVPGTVGGDAIRVNTGVTLNIDNTNGQLNGGGGGGGGGGSWAHDATLYPGGGGGSGRGFLDVAGGRAGVATLTTAGPTVTTWAATSGAAGTLAGAGNGGAGYAFTLNGGNGGDWGVAGSDGQETAAFPPASSGAKGTGGAAGYAVRLVDGTAVVNFIGGYNATQVKGAVGV